MTDVQAKEIARPMAAKSIRFEDLPQLEGAELGPSPWIEIDQRRIDLFATATDDSQWIHCDVERADRERGGTIAHGFLTLSLLPVLFERTLEVTGSSHMINYGLNRLRFTAPVLSGTRIRIWLKVLEVVGRGDGYQVTLDVRFEAEHCERPVCFAESVVIYYP